MTKTLQPHSLKLVIDWFELEDDAYPDVGLPLGISILAELQVEPNSMFTVMKNIDGVVNLESTWYKTVEKIADRAPKNSVEDVDDELVQRSALGKEELEYHERQGGLDSADDMDTSETISESESVTSSAGSSATVRLSSLKPKPSKIPVRKSGLDGTFDDLDLDIPPSPTVSSQDSLPWHSTKDIDDYTDEDGQTGIDIDDLFTELDDIYQPILRYENGDINLHAAREVEPGFYKVEIAFYRHFTKEDQGWWGVDLCDVIETCPPIPGKMVFNIQDHPSLATQIVGPDQDDLHEMDDGSFEASFDPREKPYLAFWAWTHATYLEFWGEREVDERYYDDLIAGNAYLDSDELVDYIEFMFKSMDNEDDVSEENLETPEMVSKSKHYMSPIAEEEEQESEEDQVEDTVQEDVTTLNVDNVISGSEKCSAFISEEDCESEEDEDVVWDNIPIPNVDNVVLDSEEGSISSSVEEEKVTDIVLENVTVLNAENVVSDPEERPVMPIVKEAAENMIQENVTAPKVEIVERESEEDEMRFGGPLHTHPDPVPDYAESLEWCQKQLAMSAAQAAFRRRAVFFLHRILPALFILILTSCACMNGPPVTISTPTNTLHTVKHYANHLGGLGYNALKKNVDVPFPDFSFYQRGWFVHETTYTPTTTSSNEREAEDFGDVEEYFLWKLVDETLEQAGITDCSAVFESAEPTAESVVSPSSSSSPPLDAEMSPSPQMTAEATTPASTLTADPSADIRTAASTEIRSTLDHVPTEPAQTETAVLSFAIKEDAFPRLCPSRHRNPNDPYPHNCPRPPPPSPPLSTVLAGFAKAVLRHIACSTSPICTISRISDKYEHPRDIFARFQCDGKGGWKPATRRDGFDRFLGWVPDECKIEA